MKKEIKVNKRQADSINLPKTLLQRLELLEERLPSFDKDRLAEEAIEQELDRIEKTEGLLVDWEVKPVYLDEPSLKNSP